MQDSAKPFPFDSASTNTDCFGASSCSVRGMAGVAAEEPPEASEGKTSAGSGDAELRRIIQAFSDSLHSLGHDLKEPIRAVRCYGQLLDGNDTVRSDADLREYVHIIVGAADRMDDLISRMLEYSSLLQNDTKPQDRVDMNIAVQIALANLHLKLDETSATVVSDFLPEVFGDCICLAELLQNLIGNSLKYRGAAPPQVFIRAEQVGRESVFSVEDNGIGIDPRYHESIFMPFKRLHGREVPGTGLGLAICRRIVERHGGRIWVESVPDKGAVFRFTLPACFSSDSSSACSRTEAE